jgi:hypothetical protein
LIQASIGPKNRQCPGTRCAYFRGGNFQAASSRLGELL